MIENLKTIANKMTQLQHEKSRQEDEMGRHDALADQYEHSEQTDSMLAQRAEQGRMKLKVDQTDKEIQKLQAQQQQIENRIAALDGEIANLETQLKQKRDEKMALQG